MRNPLASTLALYVHRLSLSYLSIPSLCTYTPIGCLLSTPLDTSLDIPLRPPDVHGTPLVFP